MEVGLQIGLDSMSTWYSLAHHLLAYSAVAAIAVSSYRAIQFFTPGVPMVYYVVGVTFRTRTWDKDIHQTRGLH
jgi:hypothetical protein